MKIRDNMKVFDWLMDYTKTNHCMAFDWHCTDKSLVFTSADSATGNNRKKCVIPLSTILTAETKKPVASSIQYGVHNSIEFTIGQVKDLLAEKIILWSDYDAETWMFIPHSHRHTSWYAATKMEILEAKDRILGSEVKV